MKTYKKIVSVLLTLVLAMSLMAGCGGTTEESTKGGTEVKEKAENENKEVEVDAAELEPVELLWYTIGDGPQPGQDMVNDAVNAYLKDKINATLKMEILSWGDFPDKLPVMSAAGEEFDLCFTSHWANNFRVQAARGAFVPFNDPDDNYYEKYMPKTYEMLSDYIDNNLIDGVSYAVPTNKEMALNAIMVFNQGIADKYNLDISTVKSFADLEPLLKVVKENEPDMIPLDVIDWSVTQCMVLDQPLNTTPIVVVEEDGKLIVKHAYELPELIENFDVVHDYYQKGYIREDILAIEDNNTDISVGRSFCIPQSGKPGKDVELSIQWGYELTQVELTDPVVQTNNVTGSMLGISATSSNPERAAMFIELLNTDKTLNNLINFGIEGVHYEKIDDNMIRLSADVPENQTYAMSGSAWSRQNQFLNYLIEGEDLAKWDNFEKFNTEAELSPIFGFSFDTSPVKNEEAACKSVTEKWDDSFTKGVLSFDEYYEDAMSEYEAAGLDALIAEIQSQLDAWVESK